MSELGQPFWTMREKWKCAKTGSYELEGIDC